MNAIFLRDGKLVLKPETQTEYFALDRWHQEWIAGTASLEIETGYRETIVHQSTRVINPDPSAREEKR